MINSVSGLVVSSSSGFPSNTLPTTSSAFVETIQDYGIIESLLKSMQKFLFTFVGFGSVPLRRILQVVPGWFQVSRNIVTLLHFNKSLT